MHDLAHSNAALRTLRSFLGQVAAKIRAVGKMKIGTTKDTVRVTIHDLLSGALKAERNIVVLSNTF